MSETDPLLDRAAIQDAFRLLGDRLLRRGVVADIYIIGGAAMALAYGALRFFLLLPDSPRLRPPNLACRAGAHHPANSGRPPDSSRGSLSLGYSGAQMHADGAVMAVAHRSTGMIYARPAIPGGERTQNRTRERCTAGVSPTASAGPAYVTGFAAPDLPGRAQMPGRCL